MAIEEVMVDRDLHRMEIENHMATAMVPQSGENHILYLQDHHMERGEILHLATAPVDEVQIPNHDIQPGKNIIHFK